MKIAFFVQHLICGGVENSLLTLVKVLKERDCAITIYVIDKRGEFIEKLPDGVDLKEIEIPKKIKKYLPVGGTKIGIRNRIKDKKFIQALGILLKHFKSKNEFAELDFDFSILKPIKEEYDIAVNYHMHSPFLVRYLSEKVVANKKYTWIHNDFTTTGYHIKALEEYLACNNGFFAVSDQLKDEFLDLFHEYASVTSIARNIIDVEKIRAEAEKFYPTEFQVEADTGIKLLTCGRLEYQKGYDIAIEVCKKLKDEKLNFRWYVLGKGTEYKLIKKKIKKYDLEQYFILLGVRLNPYPYFRNCDIYVQTSRHEGCAITIDEAKALCKPIVCTDVAGVREQLRDGSLGEIAEIDTDSINEKLKRLMQDEKKQNEFSECLKHQGEQWEYPFLSIFENNG